MCLGWWEPFTVWPTPLGQCPGGKWPLDSTSWLTAPRGIEHSWVASVKAVKSRKPGFAWNSKMSGFENFAKFPLQALWNSGSSYMKRLILTTLQNCLKAKMSWDIKIVQRMDWYSLMKPLPAPCPEPCPCMINFCTTFKVKLFCQFYCEISRSTSAFSWVLLWPKLHFTMYFRYLCCYHIPN